MRRVDAGGCDVWAKPTVRCLARSPREPSEPGIGGIAGRIAGGRAPARLRGRVPREPPQVRVRTARGQSPRDSLGVRRLRRPRSARSRSRGSAGLLRGSSAASAAAACTSGSASSAPAPSPTVTPWSSSGSSAIRSSALACAGSPLLWPASHQSGARNATRCADQRARRRDDPVQDRPACAAPRSGAGSPSSRRGRRRPRSPAAAAGRPSTGRARRSPSRIAAHLRIHARSSIAAPRRARSPRTRPSRTARRSASPAAVVPPTLRSPSTTRSVPESASSSATAMPARNAASASSGVSASSMSSRPEPRRTRCRVDLGGQLVRVAVQRHVDDAHRHAEAPGEHGDAGGRPPATSRTSSAALPAGRAETPSSATPWSPANSTTRGRSTGRTGTAACAAASHSPSSSSRPSAPGGTPAASRRSSASRRTPPSGRSIRSEKSSRSRRSLMAAEAYVTRPRAVITPGPARAARASGAARTARYRARHGRAAAAGWRRHRRRAARARTRRANAAFSRPSSSRKRRPDAVAGTTPEPTSLLTATTVRRVRPHRRDQRVDALRAAARSPPLGPRVVVPGADRVHRVASATATDSRSAAAARPPPAAAPGRRSRRCARSRAPVAVRGDPGGPLRVAVAAAAGRHVHARRGRPPAAAPPPRDLPERAPPSTRVRRGTSGTAWYSPTTSVVAVRHGPRPRRGQPAVQLGARAARRGRGGRRATSVVGPTAPAARSRASASGRPSTSSSTMSYGGGAGPVRPDPAGAAPGGRYSSRSPSGPVTS